jgi:hypothetical protein
MILRNATMGGWRLLRFRRGREGINMAEKSTLLFRRLHFEINLALWSGLIAFLIVFGLFVAPNVRAYQAAYQASKASEQSSQNDMYCRRWNFVPGTEAYRSCLDDLYALRMSIENKLATENDF